MNFADNCGLLVSLTTMPFSDEKNFYENDLEGLINGYKSKQKDFAQYRHLGEDKQKESQEFDDYLYVPRPYFMFGNYDLAILSLIDDYTLPNRNFHPYSYFVAEDQFGEKRDHSFNFKYQIITGPLPIIADERDENREYAIEKARQTFLAQHEREELQNKKGEEGYAYPFIAISRVKVNNSLLIGSGAILVALIEKALKEMLKKEQLDTELDFIISESFSWHELTLVFFFTSFHKISEVLIKIRELRLEDLLAYDNEEQDFYNHISENCLLQDFIDYDEEEHPECEACEAHVFLTTLTSFGFDFELLDHYELGQDPPQFDKRFKKPEIDEATFHLLIKWNVKPGHLINVLHNFEKDNEASSVSFMVGGEDYIFPVEPQYANLKSVFNFFKGAILDPSSYTEPYDQIKYHARKINTTPQIRYSFETLSALINREERELKGARNTRRHYFFHKNLKIYAFSLSELKEIRRLLYSCHVSKILREKILNMYVNYNDGIQDPILFVYFIELRPYLVRIQEEIQWFSNNFTKGDKLHETLDRLVIGFEQAFKNRFHQSYRMDGVTDFNMEYNGGCQQIISALDGAYKVICSALGEAYKPTSFVIVSGLAGVDSSMFSMRLNYFHIFQPSIFMASSVKESVNHYFHRRNIVEDAFHGEDAPLSFSLNKLKDLRKNLKKVGKRLKHKHPGIMDFVEMMDNTMLLDFQSDIITYLYGYNMDSQLFSFWYWNNFMQISSNYNSDGKFDKDNFLKFLTRHIVVLEFLDPGYIEGKSDFLNLSNVPNVQISELWINSFAKIRRFVKALLENKKCELTDCLSSIAKVGLFSTLYDTQPDPFEISIAEDEQFDAIETLAEGCSPEKRHMIRRKLNRIYAKFPGLSFDSEEKLALEARFLVIDARVSKFRKRFLTGDLIQFNYDGQDLESPALFLQSLSYAYLKILMYDLMKLEDQKNPLLLRYESGEEKTASDQAGIENRHKGMVHLLQDLDDFAVDRHNNPLVFDPMGGLFSVQHTTRRRYYQYRTTLIRSLWDFSLRMKKQMFEPIEYFRNREL